MGGSQTIDTPYHYSTEAPNSPGSSGKSYVSVRYLVLVLGFLGWAIDFLMRFTISVAIVAMVNTTQPQTNVSENACPAAFNTSHAAHTSSPGAGEYNWSLQQQGIILGIFFWGYFFMRPIGGRIAEVLGERSVLGVTAFLCGVGSLLCPLAASIHPMVLAALRLLMGLLLAPFNPALTSILARWSLPQERTTFIAIAWSGIGAGLGVALGSSGLVVQAFGWRWVFYGGGLLGVCWSLVWMVCVRDSPADHPFISSVEKELLAQVHVQPRRRVPWSRVVRCKSLYLCIIVEFSTTWSMALTCSNSPAFLTDQVGISLEWGGLVLLIMSAGSCFGSVTSGITSDALINKGGLSKLNTRRLVHSCGMVMVMASGAAMIWKGCNPAVVSVTLTTLAMGFSLSSSTYSVTPIDIAPNFAGTLQGLVGLGDAGGFLGPIVNSYLMPMNQGWDLIILITCAIYVVAGCCYVAGISTDEVEWNLYEQIGEEEEEEEDSDEQQDEWKKARRQ